MFSLKGWALMHHGRTYPSFFTAEILRATVSTRWNDRRLGEGYVLSECLPLPRRFFSFYGLSGLASLGKVAQTVSWTYPSHYDHKPLIIVRFAIKMSLLGWCSAPSSCIQSLLLLLLTSLSLHPYISSKALWSRCRGWARGTLIISFIEFSHEPIPVHRVKTHLETRI